MFCTAGNQCGAKRLFDKKGDKNTIEKHKPDTLQQHGVIESCYCVDDFATTVQYKRVSLQIGNLIVWGKMAYKKD